MGTVIVIGGGISGLTAAYALRRAGQEVTVVEQGARPGGRVHSERLGGFLMEHGPNTMLSPARPAEALIAELGLQEEKIIAGDAARRRYLVRGGCLHGLSLEPRRLVTSNFLSLAGRVRMLMEPWIKACPGEETVASFARRRFGREFLDYVMEPLAGGLCAGDAGQLSVSAVFPQLKRLERDYGSVICGVIRSCVQRGLSGPHRSGKRLPFSFREGLGTLPRALQQRLAESLRLGWRAEAVHRGPGGGFRVRLRRGAETRCARADAVIVALPAYAAGAILEPLAPRTAEALLEISHPPLAVVFLGYRSCSVAHALDGTGLLAPAVEQRNIMGILFSSVLFKGRAPPGHAAFTAFVGGARRPDLARLGPGELAHLVHSELRDLLGARAAPCLARVRYWRHGLPQAGLNHGAVIGRIRAFETEHAGVFLTGNYLSGVSIATCVETAVETAQRVQHYLLRHCVAASSGAEPRCSGTSAGA